MDEAQARAIGSRQKIVQKQSPKPPPPPRPPASQNALPDVLAVVQVALEGAISARAAAGSLARGELPQGDLIPWTVGQQFQVGGVLVLLGGGGSGTPFPGGVGVWRRSRGLLGVKGSSETLGL